LGRFADKVWIVTGTGGSIGRATALTVGHEGASVVCCDVAVESGEETVEQVHAAGGTMVSLQPRRLSDSAECGSSVVSTAGSWHRLLAAVPNER
jgi:NAD(P)-dependent dehydrogenase (short-subunit alcohol dehydrogenase family)